MLIVVGKQLSHIFKWHLEYKTIYDLVLVSEIKNCQLFITKKIGVYADK